MRGLVRNVVVLAAASVAVVLSPSTGWADTPTGWEFGQHVVACEQAMGFTGQHNPGMHEGFSGWDPDHMC